MISFSDDVKLSGSRAVQPSVPIGIVAVGSYLPPTILKNDDFWMILEKMGRKIEVKTSDFGRRREKVCGNWGGMRR